jgi:Tfp pilus assembly protein PilZ
MDTNKREDGIERRRAQRVYAGFVEYCLVEDESSKKYQAMAENISTSGICIYSSDEIKTNALLLITIYLFDGSNPIESKGKVAWTRPSTYLNIDKKHFDVGVEFVEISTEDRDRIIHYTAKNIRKVPPSE